MEEMVHAPQKADLSRKESAILELPQEVSDEEAAQHEAHGEEGCVGVGRVKGVDNYCRVAGRVVVHNRLLHSWVPGIINR